MARKLLLLQLFVCAFFSPFGLFPAEALAESDDLAKGHFLAGQAYYQQARYNEAIREFEEAYRLSAKPALLFNLAQAYERLGKLEKTVEYLQTYLAAPDIKDRPAVEERLKNLQARLKQTGIQIITEVNDATVEVDGKIVGKTPLYQLIPVSSGSHEIKVMKRGHEPFSAYVSVLAGSTVQVLVKLPPMQGNAVQPLTTSKTEKAGAAEESSGGPETSSPRRHLWTWILGATSGAMLLTCGITGGLALSKANDANAPAVQDKDKADSAKSLALISDITLGLGIGAAIGATVLYFYEGKAEQPKTVLAPFWGPKGAGVSAQVNF